MILKARSEVLRSPWMEPGPFLAGRTGLRVLRKRALMIGGLLGSALFSLPLVGQGLIQLVTFGGANSGVPSQAAYVLDQDGRTPVFGANYSAQLYAGPAGTPETQLQPVGMPRTFDLEDGLLPEVPGWESEFIATVPGVPGGQRAQLQLRAWNNEGGQKPSWETATIRGKSKSFLSVNRLGHEIGPGQFVPIVLGQGDFQLLPAVPDLAPLDGSFQRIYISSHEPDSPVSRDFRLAGGGGSAVLFQASAADSVEPSLHLRFKNINGVWQQDDIGRLEFPGDPTTWHVTGISADGSVLSLDHETDLGPRAYLWRDGTLIELAFSRTLALSGDGVWLFAGAFNGDFVRSNLFTGRSEVLREAGPGENVAAHVTAVSQDGRVALVVGERVSPETAGEVLWMEGRGFVTQPIPVGFSARGLSGDGNTVVGSSAEGRPAFFRLNTVPTQVRFASSDPSIIGSINGCSFDGSILCGSATGPTGRFVVFTEDGQAYRLKEVLPHVSPRHMRTSSLSHTEGVRISLDGRTLFGTSSNPLELASYGFDEGWIANIVFPGEGPALAIGRTAAGRTELSFPTRRGFRYHLRHSPTLSMPPRSWPVEGAEFVGSGVVHRVELPGSEASGFYALEVVPVSP